MGIGGDGDTPPTPYCRTASTLIAVSCCPHITSPAWVSPPLECLVFPTPPPHLSVSTTGVSPPLECLPHLSVSTTGVSHSPHWSVSTTGVSHCHIGVASGTAGPVLAGPLFGPDHTHNHFHALRMLRIY